MHIRDISTSDLELLDVIDTVINEIAVETRMFKKLFGFTVHKDIDQYNFMYIARMNEQVEMEPTFIEINPLEPLEIIEFINKGEFPDVTVDKNLMKEEAESRFIGLLDLFNEEGYSVLDKFEERGSSYYFCYDEQWRKANDYKRFAMASYVVPNISELNPELMNMILPALIAGCKFYFYDTMHSPDDVQATNYDFMRWHQAKENLVNLYPTNTFSTKELTRWL